MTGTHHQPPLSYAVRKVAGCFVGGEEQVPELSPFPRIASTALLVCPFYVVL